MSDAIHRQIKDEMSDAIRRQLWTSDPRTFFISFFYITLT
jgi:hypothetical protein